MTDGFRWSIGDAFSKVHGMEDQDESLNLRSSFEQARKEFWFMIVTWVFFAGWTTTYNGLFAKGEPGVPVEIVLGVPRWVVFGVGLPWVVAVSVTVWFAFCFMKDTPLGGEEEGE
tara:strand:- start:7402 stop:7746 length:345 start_codon:yes stop_codon:yes gene_type:complete